MSGNVKKMSVGIVQCSGMAYCIGNDLPYYRMCKDEYQGVEVEDSSSIVHFGE